MSYDAPFVLTCSLDRENPDNYDHFHFYPGVSVVRASPRAPRRGARLVLHPSETLDRRLRFSEFAYANAGSVLTLMNIRYLNTSLHSLRNSKDTLQIPRGLRFPMNKNFP